MAQEWTTMLPPRKGYFAIADDEGKLMYYQPCLDRYWTVCILFHVPPSSAPKYLLQHTTDRLEIENGINVIFSYYKTLRQMMVTECMVRLNSLEISYDSDSDSE